MSCIFISSKFLPKQKIILFVAYNFTEKMIDQVLKEASLANEDIVIKSKKHPQWKKQLEEIQKTYSAELNMSLYSNLDQAEKLGAFQLLHRDRLFVIFYGFRMNGLSEEQFFKIYLLWISKMDELVRNNLKMRYILIYFHSMAESVTPYIFIKDSYKKLPSPYYALLDKMYVVEPTFLVQKAGIFQFERLSKLYDRKMVQISSIKKLGLIEEIYKNQIIQCLPEILNIDILNSNKKKQNQVDNKQILKPIPFSNTKPNCLSVSLSMHKFNQQKIPIYLTILFNTLLQYSDMLKLQGIFRKSGSIEDQEEIIEYLSTINDEGSILPCPETGMYSGHAITGVIKKFFTKLIQPIIPFKIYNKIMAVKDIKKEDELSFVKNIIESLPPVNRGIIFYVVKFLCEKVIPHSQQNKMNSYNLSVVFFPCFFRPQQSSVQDLFNAGRFARIFQIFFQKYDEILETKQNGSESKRGSRDSKDSKGNQKGKQSMKPHDLNKE